MFKKSPRKKLNILVGSLKKKKLKMGEYFKNNCVDFKMDNMDDARNAWSQLSGQGNNNENITKGKEEILKKISHLSILLKFFDDYLFINNFS